MVKKDMLFYLMPPRGDVVLCRLQLGKEEKKKKTSQLEKQDYYFDNEGLMVFTRSYHLKRGFCCNSGCKNCPYPRK